MGIIVALCVLSFLVFFHELGHFIIARIFGVKVEVFSIGFGKKLLTYHLKGTEYAISLVPLGGYVKLKGQDDSNPRLQNNEPDSYLSKTPLQRIAILLAGPLFNILLAFLLYVVVGVCGKVSLLPIVGDVKADYPAALVGIKAGDRILSINGQSISTWEELDSIIMQTDGTLEIDIRRDVSENVLQILSFSLTPIQIESENIFKERVMRNVIGVVSAGSFGVVTYHGWQSVEYAFKQTLWASSLIAQSLLKFVSGDIPSSELGGVVSIVSVVSAASDSGFISLLLLTALISVNLGIINLLPIPALDGGHIIFNTYELLTRKRPSENVAYYLTLCGWAILIALMFLGLYNDIVRLSVG